VNTVDLDPQDVHRLAVGDREFILIGTAHVSRESADLVGQVIHSERPDRVCVELDEQRFQALSQRDRWDRLDLRQIIRSKQVATLLLNLLLSSYQKKIGNKLGVLPGTELLAAVRVAEAAGIPYSLCDRNVRTTLLRAWRSMSLWQRSSLLGGLLGGMFAGGELTEADLRELRKTDVLSELLRQLAQDLPALKRVLIDERDVYLAEKIRSAEGRRIVAVVGAGHVEGIRRLLAEGLPTALEPIERIPVASPVWRWMGWGIPVSILGSFGLIAWTKGPALAGASLGSWILATGTPCALGAIVAVAHPLTIVTAFLAAPITTLSPVIGAGHVTALVQAYVQPPRVQDFHGVAEDAGSLARWWRNRLLRVLLAFIFPSLGAMIGLYLGGAGLISSLF